MSVEESISKLLSSKSSKDQQIDGEEENFHINTIAKNFSRAVEIDTFYSLPFDTIEEIATRYYLDDKQSPFMYDDYDDVIFNTTVKLLTTLCQNNQRETALLLNIISIPNPTLHDCVSIIGTMTTSPICQSIKTLYEKEQENVDVDLISRLEEKNKEISILQKKLAEIDPFLAQKPLEFVSDIYKACAQNNLQSVQYLIEREKIPPDYDNDFQKRTPLFISSESGHLDIVKYLYSHYADINHKTTTSDTPLIASSSKDHLEVVEYLIEQGAQVNDHNNKGNTALFVSSENGYMEIVKCLVEHGANVNDKNNDRISPLYISSQKGYIKVV